MPFPAAFAMDSQAGRYWLASSAVQLGEPVSIPGASYLGELCPMVAGQLLRKSTSPVETQT